MIPQVHFRSENEMHKSRWWTWMYGWEYDWRALTYHLLFLPIKMSMSWALLGHMKALSYWRKGWLLVSGFVLKHCSSLQLSLCTEDQTESLFLIPQALFSPEGLQRLGGPGGSWPVLSTDIALTAQVAENCMGLLPSTKSWMAFACSTLQGPPPVSLNSSLCLPSLVPDLYS